MEERSYLAARFFKVILPSTTNQHRLRIPNKFGEKYENELSSIVKLTDPTNGTWCVRLERVEKTLWLHDGWEKFFEDHSISYGNFLLFIYRGNSCFNVLIFHLTGIEVDYPNNNCNFEMEENSDDDSVKFLASSPGKPKISSLRDRGGNKCNSDAAEMSKFNRCYLTRSKCKIEDGGLEVKTENLRLKNPSFTVILKPYNLFPKCSMYLPATFSEYLSSASDRIELHDSIGKKWLVHVIRRNRVIFLGRGWGTVVKEKSLKVGDRCVFELIHINIFMLKVFTFCNTSKSRIKQYTS
ncbi:B3 domain-containing transcription factor VRN1 [Forsythia ovata]|uniref:B3 domain-containing transcription factor VRN1 n=1 Tax=Forsythia ovata TaxID=205694 RepID=A0ABD1R1X9_9LAMI